MNTLSEEPRGHKRVDAAGNGSADEGLAGLDAGELREMKREEDGDAEWLSMTTGDPALYIKDPE